MTETEIKLKKKVEKVVPFKATKKAPEERGWDKNRAIRSLRKWASSDGSGDKDKINWAKYRQGFAWYDPDHADDFGGYKLPHHEVIDGELCVVWRGVAAAMAAIMSTVDSQLLVAASAVEQDIYIRYFGGHPGDRAAVWIGRLTVLVLGALALPIAWNPASVYNTVFNAWGVLAAGLGPVVCLGLLSRRTNRWGATVGMLVGMAVAQLWPEIKPLFGGDLLFRNGLIPGFFLNLALAYLVSLATPTERTRQAR